MEEFRPAVEGHLILNERLDFPASARDSLDDAIRRASAERGVKDASCLVVPFIIRVVEVAAGVARPGEGSFQITDENPD